MLSSSLAGAKPFIVVSFGGLGIVEVEVTHRWRKGRALRERRVHKRGLAQQQFGRRLGIDPMLLNDVERGRAELPAHVEQRLLEELEQPQ